VWRRQAVELEATSEGEQSLQCVDVWHPLSVSMVCLSSLHLLLASQLSVVKKAVISVFLLYLHLPLVSYLLEPFVQLSPWTMAAPVSTLVAMFYSTPTLLQMTYQQMRVPVIPPYCPAATLWYLSAASSVLESKRSSIPLLQLFALQHELLTLKTKDQAASLLMQSCDALLHPHLS